MPLQSMLVRLRTVELAGTVLPGLFVVVSILFVRAAARARDWLELERSIALVMNSDPKWFSVAVFIVSSFVCGSLIRAFPFRIVDAAIGRLLRPLYSKAFFGARMNALYSGHFPYPEMLRKIHEQLAQCGYLDALPGGPSSMSSGLRDNIDSSSFEYWKAFVAARNPGLASQHEASEGRTRLFSGMFWATACAFTISVAGAVLSAKWLPLSWAILSAGMFSVFAIRYRHITGEEVRHAYISFLTQACIGGQAGSAGEKDRPKDGETD